MTKTRARRIVEISDNLAAWLLPYSKKLGPVTPDDYPQGFEDIRRSAGTDPWPRNAMRHSAASHHLALNRNESLTQAMLGHESGKMLIQHYRELVKPMDAVRYWQIMPSAEAGEKIVAIA
jgi:integrase